MSAEDIRRIIEDKRVVVCVGSGGVGKTTTAAAIALYGTLIGKRTLVITIDPAKRLADSFGLPSLMASPQEISRGLLEPFGVPPKGALYAMMLDLTFAWDSFVRRAAPTPKHADDVLDSRLYHALSRDLPGAQEFIACEALYTLTHERDFDLIVLDTPPTANALHFLDAPDRILAMLESDAMKMFMRTDEKAARRIGLRFLDTARSAAFSAFSKFTGAAFQEELGAFLVTFRDMYAPIAARTRGMQKLLTSSSTSFFIVTAPVEGALREAAAYHSYLTERKHPVDGLLINRHAQSPSFHHEELTDARAAEFGISEVNAPRYRQAMRDEEELFERQSELLRSLETNVPKTVPRAKIFRRGTPIGDLHGLYDLLTDIVGLTA